MTGEEIRAFSDEQLDEEVESVDVFAEVDPVQKERIVRAFRHRGHTVGFLGDGINDAPGLHAADVGISVDTAADVAKDSASIVLLDKDLEVLLQGVRLGRQTFANTLKYVFVTTSANFGNMASMAGASLFLPYLPLLPMQILLLNFLSDLPATTISGDSVDPEQVEKPEAWNIHSVRDFMVVFGLISSIFDFMTFGTLKLAFDASAELFRGGWFLESLATELAVMLDPQDASTVFPESDQGPYCWEPRPHRDYWPVAGTNAAGGRTRLCAGVTRLACGSGRDSRRIHIRNGAW